MKKWIIKRYNKGQDKYIIHKFENNAVYLIDKNKPLGNTDWNDWTYLYEFLFNPEWGFAKAFTKNLKKKEEYTLSWHCHENDFDRVLKIQMVISEDVLKYLEQFK